MEAAAKAEKEQREADLAAAKAAKEQAQAKAAAEKAAALQEEARKTGNAKKAAEAKAAQQAAAKEAQEAEQAALLAQKEKAEAAAAVAASQREAQEAQAAVQQADTLAKQQAGDVSVTVDEAGRVGVWMATPQSVAHVHSDNAMRSACITASGKTAALSFTDQQHGREWDNGGPGQRWEWKSSGKVAHLSTPTIPQALTVSATGQLGVGKVSTGGQFEADGHVQCSGVNSVSSLQQKEDVQAYAAEEAMQLLQSLQPKRFQYRGAEEEFIGLIAEETPPSLLNEEGNAVLVPDLVGVLASCVKQQQQQQQELQQQMQQNQQLIESVRQQLRKR